MGVSKLSHFSKSWFIFKCFCCHNSEKLKCEFPSFTAVSGIKVVCVSLPHTGCFPSSKEVSPVERNSAPLAAAMLGELSGAGEVDTEEEDEGGSEREFEEPLCALVKNCNMLHNIVGPACIFLRQGFAQSQLVCMAHTHTHTKSYAFKHSTELSLSSVQ